MDEGLREVLAIFAEETQEQAAAIGGTLIEVAQAQTVERRKALLAEVYRYAHTIKGNAGAFGLLDLEGFAHALETVLLPFRSGEKPVSPALATAFLEAVDCALRRVNDASAGRMEPDPSLAQFAQHLQTLCERSPNASVNQESDEQTNRGDRAIAQESDTGRTGPTRSEPASSSERKSPHETIRVSVERLSSLDRQIDELREVRSALGFRTDDVRRLVGLLESALGASVEDLGREFVKGIREQLLVLQRGLSAEVSEFAGRLSSAEEELRHIRMLPVETILSPLSRAVWEHANAVGKKVRLESSGTDVALDRRLLEELKDPLMHMLRNAVDHGLEKPEERASKGKPPEGLIRVDVEQKGAKVVLTLQDDGRGVVSEAVRQRAVERGLITTEAASVLGEQGTYELLFAPGFSTAEQVTRTSGRGVGLDVVRENMQKVGGKVSLSSVPNMGTRFTLELPLTLATAQALLFQVAGFQLAIPLSAVARSLYLPRVEAGRRTIEVDGQPLPLHSLARLMGLTEEAATDKRGTSVVVIRSGERLIAVRVDRLFGERDVVVRALPPEMVALRHLTSAASVGDGSVVFMLSPRALADSAHADRGESAPTSRATQARILVADDSITTRALHRQLLEAAGYEVETVGDGAEALRLLRTRGADLVVSDVRMPRLDGLSLARIVRDELKVPCVLVSSLDTDEDRARAKDAGASAYLPKRAYRGGELIRVIESLLKR